MRKYPCKKEVSSQFMESTMQEIFGNVHNEDQMFVSAFSESLEVRAKVTGKKEISVETKTKPSKDMEKAVSLYNKFLKRATGYTAKERKRLVSKE